MYNQLVAEAAFVDNYLDSVENLPDDIARHMSKAMQIDVEYRSLLRDVDHYYDLFKSLEKSNDLTATIRRNRAVARISHSLIQAKELGDEKMQIVQVVAELIEQKTRQLDIDQKNVDCKEELQHHLMQAVDDIGGAVGGSTPKRIQSPAPAVSMPNGNGSGGGGGSSPNSERSGSNGNHRLAVGNSSNGNASNSNYGANDCHRAAMKRPRRRNESNANNGAINIELGGNESNSANEAGSSILERKNSNASLIQKKSSSQNQSNPNAMGGAGGSLGGTSSGNIGGAGNAGKKKKRRARGQSSAMVAEEPPEAIDPDEPTYCVCNQISFGEMILCDNDLCPIEWFHFSCVSLVLKPKGKWFCPNCRGDRPNIMKPKSQFLKELERYNKEKEEKT